MEDLKLALIKKIINCDKMETLLECDQMFKKYYNIYSKNVVSEPETLYKKDNNSENIFENEKGEIVLSASQLKSIEIGEEDIKNGRFYTEEEMDEMDEEVIILPNSIQEMIDISLDDVKNGNDISEEEVFARDNGLLNDKNELVLPSEIIEILKMSDKQIDEGKFYTGEEVENYFTEWLAK